MYGRQRNALERAIRDRSYDIAAVAHAQPSFDFDVDDCVRRIIDAVRTAMSTVPVVVDPVPPAVVSADIARRRRSERERSCHPAPEGNSVAPEEPPLAGGQHRVASSPVPARPAGKEVRFDAAQVPVHVPTAFIRPRGVVVGGDPSTLCLVVGQPCHGAMRPPVGSRDAPPKIDVEERNQLFTKRLGDLRTHIKKHLRCDLNLSSSGRGVGVSLGQCLDRRASVPCLRNGGSVVCARAGVAGYGARGRAQASAGSASYS